MIISLLLGFRNLNFYLLPTRFESTFHLNALTISFLLMNLGISVLAQTSAFPECESEDPGDPEFNAVKHFFLFHSFKATFYRSSDEIKINQFIH